MLREKNTSEAIHIIRRIIEAGERADKQLHVILLDWEKAFDKVDQEGLMEALERMDVHPKLITLTRALYQNPTFKVEMDGDCSEWKKQTTGPRQGCTLSPYLFLILMTVIFHDTHDDPELEKY